MPTPASERALAARILLAVIVDKKTTDQLMQGAQIAPICQEFVLGSLRHYFSLRDAIEKHLEQPFRRKDQDLMCLLLVGAYQLQHMRIPDHAAIHETVSACQHLRKPWARGLLNAVLRRLATDFSEDAAGASEDAADFLEGATGTAAAAGASSTVSEAERMFDLPDWMISRLRAAYPAQATAIFAGCLLRAPMSLRVNLSRTSTADYCRLLENEGIAQSPGLLPEHLVLATPVASNTLPGYATGSVSVQDAGALFAAELLATTIRGRPGEVAGKTPTTRLLDACAAPGGKLFHCRERLPDAELVAVELNPRRCDHLRQEASRLGAGRLTVIEGDATSLAWWSGEPFDTILLDAPCSGSGTLRRHPDIKLLRKAADLAVNAQLQTTMLTNLWRTLRPGGNLLYCTCSLFTEENDAVVGEFVEKQEDALINAIKLPIGQATTHGWQLLPLQNAGVPRSPQTAAPDLSVDGFYYALLEKSIA
jgi:16S rRNA (cytosine967-C5)-methyltransferase